MTKSETNLGAADLCGADLAILRSLCGLCGSPSADGMAHLECSQREQAREDWVSDARQDNVEAAGGDLWREDR